MDVIQYFPDLLGQAIHRYRKFLKSIPSHCSNLILFNILRTYFKSEGHTLHFPIVKLPARAVGIPVIHFNSEVLCQFALYFISLIQYAFLMECYRQDNNLNRCNPRRHHQPSVISMHHYDATYQSGGYAPGGAPAVFSYPVLIKELYIKHLCKILPQIMRGSCLQSLAVMHHSFHGIGLVGSRKPFLLTLFPQYNRHGQFILCYLSVNLKHPQGFFLCFLFSCMNCMSFLPQEFSSSQEWPGSLFPSYNIAPLIDKNRYIPIGLNPF
ncbi:hypothetical protein SDC9_115227 [bioreactor metagenome]|uniref:Uncharacterized protein n=1 Tax=bioreactor metagenome TaxID=1076179 RepID=A0A645BSE0_9ZZZZ